VSVPETIGSLRHAYWQMSLNKKNEGMDADGDGILDAGRLVQGTYQYTEKPGGHLGARAFRVGSRIKKGKKSGFVESATQVVERDPDGDGLFASADPICLIRSRLAHS
jgi:hypothetical protein